MKIAKYRPPHLTPLPTEIHFRVEVEFRARELRLIHQVARNSPAENRRLSKVIAHQRHRLRHAISVARRYSRQIARLSPLEQQAIRRLQRSPFYVGLGAASTWQRDDTTETRGVDDLESLFDEEVFDA